MDTHYTRSWIHITCIESYMYRLYSICICFYSAFVFTCVSGQIIWANENNSLIWIKAIWGWFPYIKTIIDGEVGRWLRSLLIAQNHGMRHCPEVGLFVDSCPNPGHHCSDLQGGCLYIHPHAKMLVRQKNHM